MQNLIDVPAGLSGVAAAETALGAVDGDRGFFHYREHDATELARDSSLEEVWYLFQNGVLPDEPEIAAFTEAVAVERELSTDLADIVDSVADHGTAATPLSQLRSVLSLAACQLALTPLLDTTPSDRKAQARRLAAVVPTILARLHRRSLGLAPVANDRTLTAANAYLQAVTGQDAGTLGAVKVRALEQYLLLTVDHGFNASTFTARVVASTGADLADVACAALGAFAGPLHGGAPSRALDALDAIGDPSGASRWVRDEVRANRRIMGFGHAVYRAPDPRSGLLRDVAQRLGEAGVESELISRASAVEAEILIALAELKPGRPLPSNVEFYAGVVMAAAGIPRSMFTPTFAVSRTIGWMAHAVEQAGTGKLIRPAARYVGPPPQRMSVG